MPRTVHVKRNLLYAFCAGFLYLCVIFQPVAKAGTEPLQGKEISISVRKSSLSNILNQVSKKSGITIYFVDTDIAGYTNIDYNAKDKDVISILAELFKGKDLLYEVISEKQIGVRKVKKSESINVDERDTLVTVTGTVTNDKGQPVVGATIVSKGNTKLGTTTNTEGKFVLSGVRSNTSLIISSVSFLTTEVPIKGRQSIGSVTMKEYVGELDLVQIQAYGTTNRRVGTGNITTIKAEDIAKSPVGNPLLAISGRAPGVFIQQSSGIPGSGVKILIQGQNSIQNDNDPFFVIDGVPYVSQLLPGLLNELGTSGAGVGGTAPPTQGNPLNFINPQDIESIDILKDADATSIYGSRAQNGAVIITTKKGKVGKMGMNFNIQQGWAEVGRKVAMLTTEQYLQMRKEAYVNDGLPVPDANYTTSQKNSSNYDLTVYDPNKYTDWQEKLLGGIAKYTNVIGTISGGTNNVQYLFSAGYQREGTVVPSNLKDQKASIHFNLNSVSQNKRLKFNLTGNYLTGKNTLAAIGSLIQNAYTLAPNAPDLYNADGSLNWQYIPNTTKSTFNNPLANLNRGYENKTNNLIANSILSYQIIDGLEIKSSFGYNRLESNEVTITPLTAFAPHIRAFAQRSASYNAGLLSTWVIEPQITYSRYAGLGKLDFLVGSTFQEQNKDRQNLLASGFTSDEALYNIKSASAITVSSDADGTILSQYKYNALFSRLTYNIADKYIVNISGRRDGSSRFGRNNRFHNFGSIAGAWIFSNEDFFAKSRKVISFGKIRASYGTTGNDQIGDYAYLNLYVNTNNTGVPYQGITSLEPTERFPNPYLQWEETKKFSSTLDLGFWNDLLLLSTTFYKNTCSNQLVDYPLISSTGGRSVYQNRPIKVQNTGWEILLSSSNIPVGPINWSAAINVTIPRNKLVKYDDVDQTNQQDKVGRSLQAVRVYHFIGVDPNTGLYVVENREKKPTSMPEGDVDKTTFVDLNPRFYGGFQNTFRFKGFTFDCLFQFVKQNAPNQFFGISSPGATPVNQPVRVLNRWKNVGDNAAIQKYSTRSDTYLEPRLAAIQSDRAYSDASYIRLKNVSLSYSLPTTWMTRSKLNSARIFVQAQNLLTITSYMGDPETKTLIGSLPPLRVITLGVQAGF